METRGFVLILLLQGAFAVLELTAPTTQTAVFGSNAVLQSTFQMDKPTVDLTFLAVIWTFKGQEIVRYDSKGKVSSPRFNIDEKAAMKGNVSLSVTNVSISDEGNYKFLVIYSPDRQEKELTLKIQALPVVRMTKKALNKKNKNSIQCSVRDFYPVSINVSWYLDGQKLSGSVLDEPRRNADGTYRVNSSVIVPPSESQESPLIVCQVEHESLPKPIQDEYKVVYGVPPTVQISSSVSKDDQDNIIVCEARGFYPEEVSINILLNGKRVLPPRRNEDGSFNKELFYRIPETQKKQITNISCEVQHETLLSPIVKNLQESDQKTRSRHAIAISVSAVILAGLISAALWFLISKKKYFQRFVLSPIYQPQMWNNDKMVTLYCTAFYCPKDIQVIWTVTESDGMKYKISDSLSQEEKEQDPLISKIYTVRADGLEVDGLHNVITTLTFFPTVSRHKNMGIQCTFTCDGKSKEKNWKYNFNLKKPQVSGPIKLSLCDSEEVLGSFSLEKVYPKAIQITWSDGVGHYQDLETTKEIITENHDETVSVLSKCNIPGDRFKDPAFRVRVTWHHESMEGPEHRVLSARDPDFPWRPVLGEIITSSSPLLHGTEAKLQCKISGYFPDELEVKWLRREAGKQDLFLVSPSEKYKIPVMDVRREDDKTYTCTASLIVSVSVRGEHGAEFICRVGHPSLETPLEKRTGELSVMGIPNVKRPYQSGGYIITTIDSFYPKNIVVTWSRIKSINYEQYSESEIKNEFSENNDGTYSLISKCKTKKGIMDKKKYIKVRVEHEALKSPVEKIIVLEDGEFSVADSENENLNSASSDGPGQTAMPNSSTSHNSDQVTIDTEIGPETIQNEEQERIKMEENVTERQTSTKRKGNNFFKKFSK